MTAEIIKYNKRVVIKPGESRSFPSVAGEVYVNHQTGMFPLQVKIGGREERDADIVMHEGTIYTIRKCPLKVIDRNNCQRGALVVSNDGITEIEPTYEGFMVTSIFPRGKMLWYRKGERVEVGPGIMLRAENS